MTEMCMLVLTIQMNIYHITEALLEILSFILPSSVDLRVIILLGNVVKWLITWLIRF